MREVLSSTIFAMAIFGVIALILALLHGTTDRIIVRVLIEFPLLMIVAAISALVINIIAGLIGNHALSTPAIAAVLAGLLGWAVAAPPSFAGLGYHWMLQPTFAAALALSWMRGDALADIFARSS